MSIPVAQIKDWSFVKITDFIVFRGNSILCPCCHEQLSIDVTGIKATSTCGFSVILYDRYDNKWAITELCLHMKSKSKKEETHNCNCDLFTVLMVKGCQCGGK